MLTLGTILMLVVSIPTAPSAAADVLDSRLFTYTHHGKDYQVKLIIGNTPELTANYIWARMKFDDDGGSELLNEWDGGVPEADQIKVQWITLSRNGGVVEICDQTSDPAHDDGAGCVEGEQGTSGPCKIFHDIQNSPYAEPGCDERATNYVQTGKNLDPPGGQTYQIIVQFQIEWHTGATSPWNTEQFSLSGV